MLTSRQLEALYLEACDLDIAALKPGNVSLYSEGYGMGVVDFLLSARVSAPWVVAKGLPLGERIYRAVEATRRAVGCNTNLGILLLTVPIAMAAERGGELAREVPSILGQTTCQDTVWLYRAIRLAHPGGLGRVERGDVAEEPTISLLEAMRLAEKRDRIAWNYVHGFADIFEWGIYQYHNRLNCCGKATEAVEALYLHFLARLPDSLIARKFGRRKSVAVSRFLRRWLKEKGGAWSRGELLKLDRLLKRHQCNPGTTADLTVATVFAFGCLKGGGGHVAQALPTQKEDPAGGGRGGFETSRRETSWRS